MALQGGGIKGIAYIGAYEAMLELYGEKLNLTSVIGSSAGSLLGLGFACGAPVNFIKEQCIYEMRKVALKDKACK